MTRNQRQKLKLKYRRQLWLTLGMILLFALNLTLALTVDWMPDRMSALEGTPQLIVVGILCLVLFVPIMFALHFNVRATWTHRALYDERRRMYKEKLRHYVDLFMAAVKEKNYAEAKRLHNKYIWGDTKGLTRGILVGLLSIEGDEDDLKLAAEHMTLILDEVYDPAKE